MESSAQKFLKSTRLKYFSHTLTGRKTLKRAHIGEGPCSLNSITTALYTIHRRQRCTGCSFQLLFPQIPIEISFCRTMHFFPFEKKRENQYLVSIRVEADQYPPRLSFSLPRSSSSFPLRLWPMVNRNNGVWLLGGQGAAGGENKAADEGP